jgi:hypothetical protein
MGKSKISIAAKRRKKLRIEQDRKFLGVNEQVNIFRKILGDLLDDITA